MGRLVNDIFLLQHMDNFPRQLCTNSNIWGLARRKISPLDISSHVCESGDRKSLHHRWRIHKWWHYCYQLFRKLSILTIDWKACQHCPQYNSSKYRYFPFLNFQTLGLHRIILNAPEFEIRIVCQALIIDKSYPFRRSNRELHWILCNPF